MKAKTASKIIKNHLNGSSSVISKTILAEVAKQAIEQGLRPPFTLDGVGVVTAAGTEKFFDWGPDPSLGSRNNNIQTMEFDREGVYPTNSANITYKCIINDIPDHGMVTWRIVDRNGVPIPRNWPSAEEVVRVNGEAPVSNDIATHPRYIAVKEAMALADQKGFELTGQVKPKTDEALINPERERSEEMQSNDSAEVSNEDGTAAPKTDYSRFFKV